MDTTDARAFEDHLRAQNQPVSLTAEEFQKRGLRAHREMMIPVRGIEHPSFKTFLAVQDKLTENLLFSTWGGIGDQICIEPTLRWATTYGLLDPKRPSWRPKMTLASDYPELYGHLQFDDVYNTQQEKPIYEDYLEFRPAVDQGALTDMFINHMTTSCTDYPTLVAFRSQLKTSEKNVILRPETPKNGAVLEVAERVAQGHKLIAVHPGKHWESKTFPVDWWNGELDDYNRRGFTPVLIGAAMTRHGGGYVDVDRDGCIDLMDQTSIMESVWLLQRMPVLVCSDSSPLHMAVSGNAHIAYIATAKHPEYITHWRQNRFGMNEWGWRMKNFSKGGKWEQYCNLPVSNEEIKIDKATEDEMRSWLPTNGMIGTWMEGAFDEYHRGI